MPSKCDGVAKLKKLEQRLDRKFLLFGIQFGLDAIVGLVPILGDVLTSAAGLYIIHQSSKLGATRGTVTRMLVNWGIDFTVGLIPIVGDIFDIAFKSNTRNVKLLIADLETRAVELREVNREQRLAAAA
jgi:hypothetical protein